MQIAIDPQERIAEIYTYDMQLKASFTLGEGRHGGSSVGAPNLDTAIGESNAQMEEARGLIEVMRERGIMLDEAALLEMPEEERAIVLKYVASCGNTGRG